MERHPLHLLHQPPHQLRHPGHRYWSRDRGCITCSDNHKLHWLWCFNHLSVSHNSDIDNIEKEAKQRSSIIHPSQLCCGTAGQPHCVCGWDRNCKSHWMAVHVGCCAAALLVPVCVLLDAGRGHHALPTGVFPILIVAISAGVRHVDYGTINYCWLSTRNGVIWAFVAPILAIIMVNIVVLVMTVFSIVRMKAKFSTKREKRNIALLKTAIKSAVVLLPLLGLTWAFGLLAVNRNTIVFAWLFTIFNSLQGLFVFILHVLRNDNLLSRAKIILRKIFCTWKHPAANEVEITTVEVFPAKELIQSWNGMNLDGVAAISQENNSTGRATALSEANSTLNALDSENNNNFSTTSINIKTEEEQTED